MAKKKFAIFCRNCQLGFSSKIKGPQLGSARLEPEISSSGSSLINMYLDNFDSGFWICKTDPHEKLTNLEFNLSFHRNICIPTIYRIFDKKLKSNPSFVQKLEHSSFVTWRLWNTKVNSIQQISIFFGRQASAVHYHVRHRFSWLLCLSDDF